MNNAAAFRERRWMCGLCGYLMDAATSIEGGQDVPKEEDVTLCMNCGLVHMRHGDAWRPMTRAERASLPADRISLLARTERVRAARIDTDLSAGRGGRA